MPHGNSTFSLFIISVFLKNIYYSFQLCVCIRMGVWVQEPLELTDHMELELKAVVSCPMGSLQE